MNSTIKTFLDKYIVDPDPRYAVALRGSWGCGKTFFVDNWVEELRQRNAANPEHPDAITLQPIHVSLYGMKSVAEVVQSIDRQVRPYMHSKWMKVGKNALNILGKVALKVDLDLDGKGAQDDASFSMTLDSLSVLFSKDKDTVKGDKLLVFDDFERSNMDMKELMGFINSLVERGGCHVVIIGDFEKLNEESGKLLKDFKEKTIGRTFTIHAEPKEAIDSFLMETDEWMRSKRELVLDCFEATNTNNLRLLRQSLRDFSSILAELEQFNENSQFLEGFLPTFIAITALYNHPRYHNVLEKYSITYSIGLAGDEEARTLIGELQQKYRPLLHKYGHDCLDLENVKEVIRYLEYGHPLKDYLKEKMDNESRKMTLFEKLPLYSVLEDEEFDSLYSELEEKLLNGLICKIYDVGRGLDLLCMFDSFNIHTINPDVKNAVEKTLAQVFNTLDSADDVEQTRANFHQGLIASMIQHSLKRAIISYVGTLVAERLKIVPNKMQKILRNLDEQNIFELNKLDKQETPDRHSAYESSAVFEFESGDEIFESLKSLSNRARNVFRDFLSTHYKLVSMERSGDNSRFRPDMACLSQLKVRIDDYKAALPQGLSRFSFENLSDTLGRIIDLGGYPIAVNA